MSGRPVLGLRRPLFGMIHLLPLPGAPRYAGDLRAVVAKALADAEALEAGGIDGLMLENFGDVPFFPEQVPAWTIAAMTRCAVEIRARTRLPLGINVLRNDAGAALAVAEAAGAQFLRVNVHCHVAVSDQGLISGRAHETLRSRSLLRSKVQIAADVRVKHAQPLAPSALAAEAADVAGRGLADLLIVSGQATGSAPDPERLRTVRAAVQVPVLIGSGLCPANVASLLPLCDGAIVGSCLHVDGDLAAPIDVERVRSLVALARQTERAGQAK